MSPNNSEREQHHFQYPHVEQIGGPGFQRAETPREFGEVRGIAAGYEARTEQQRVKDRYNGAVAVGQVIELRRVA